MNKRCELLFDKIDSKKAVVGVIGLGYVGLPLLMKFASQFKVIGFDVDSRKKEMLDNKKSYISHISNSEIEKLFKKRKVEIRTDKSYSDCDCLIVCLPTPLHEDKPDLRILDGCFNDIAKSIIDYKNNPNTEDRDTPILICLESTTYPGCTENYMKYFQENEILLGIDILLSFSPEREDPGNKKYNVSNIPKLVGGVDIASSRIATELYNMVIETVINVWDSKIAEMAKLLENTYRLVNISLINEMKFICDRLNIDIWKVIEAAATKPFGFTPFYPGPSIGGHCIPIDPLYLNMVAEEAGEPSGFIKHAIEVNEKNTSYIVRKVFEQYKNMDKVPSILLIGVSYKKDVNDDRDSSFYKVWNLLTKRHFNKLFFHDPYFESVKIDGKEYKNSDPYTGEYDIIIILTDHSSIDYKKLAKKSSKSIIIDTRNVYKEDSENVWRI